MDAPEGEGEETKALAQVKDQQEELAAAALIRENDDEQRRQRQDEDDEDDEDKRGANFARRSVIVPHGVFEFRARELSPTALIKRVEIEECYVGRCQDNSKMPNQIDRTYHITISTDAADDTLAHQETVRFLTTDVMRSFNTNNTMASEDNYNTSQSNLAAATSARRQRSTDREDELAALAAEQQLQAQQMAAAAGSGQQRASARPTPIADEMSQDLQYLSREAPLDGGESTFGAYSTLGGSQLVQQQQQQSANISQQLRTPTPGGGDDETRASELEGDYERTTDFRIAGDDEGADDVARGGVPLAAVGAEQLERQQQRSQQQLEQLAPDNVDIQRPLQQAGLAVSFMTTMDEREEEEQQQRRREGKEKVFEQQGQPIDSTTTTTMAPLEAQGSLIDFENFDSGEQNEANQQQQQLAQAGAPTSPSQKSIASAIRRLKPFLVSFMVDARGGAMRGCRHSGVRVIIPPNSAPQPMRITCRYLRRERLVHPPPLMEGEACASKIMEVGPAGAKFLGPVLIEVPHFASLRGKEREIIILRSDSGEVWREHLVEADESLIDSILHSAELVEQQQQQQENNRPVSPVGGGQSDGGGGGGDSQQQQQQEKRLTRIVTTEFPQYFAIISRIRQEVHTIGPDGSVVDSQVVPRVQAIFTDGALTKRIKIGLQKKDASTEQVQDASEHQEDAAAEERARSPTSAGRPGSSAGGKRRSRFLACFGAKHGSHEFGLDQQATDGELGFASGSNDESPASSTGGDSPRHQYAANGKLVGGGHRRVPDVSDSEGDSLTLERQQRARGPPRRRSVAGELVPEDYYIEREPPLILNGEPATYGKRMASSSAQTDAAGKSSGVMSTSTRQKQGKRSILLGGRRSRSKTPMQIPFYEPENGDDQQQASQNQQHAMRRPKSTDPGASTAYSSLESNGGGGTGTEEDAGMRSSLSDLSEGTMAPSKFRTCTVQTDSDSVTVQYVTLSALPADASKVLSATTTTGGILDDGYVSGSGDAKKSFLSSCMSTQREDELLKSDKKKRGKSSDRARTLESVRESAASTEPGGRSVSLSRPDSPAKGKLVETITTTTTTTMSQSFDEPAALSNGEEADESLLTSAASATPTKTKETQKKKTKKLSKEEKQEKLRQKEVERQKQRELEAAEKARKKAEKEARKEAERLEKLERKSASRAQSPVAEQRQQVVAATSGGESDGGTLTTSSTTKTIQNVKFAPSPNKDYREERTEEVPAEPSDESDGQVVEEQQVSSTTSEPEQVTSKSKSSSKFKIKMPKISLGGGGGKGATEETTTIERVITEEEMLPAQLDEDNSMVHVSIGDATVPMAEPKVSLEEETREPITSSTIESHTSTTTPHVSETQEVIKQVAPLKPILKHQQSSVSETGSTLGDEPRSLASLADRVVTKATEEAVQKMQAGTADQVTTVTTTSEVSTSNFRTSAETVSVSESKREQARRMKAEKERQRAERDQVKLEMKLKRDEERRLLKEAERAAKQAEEAAKRAEREAKKASTLAREEAERQAKIAQFESERTIKEIETRESQVASEATTTSASSEPESSQKSKTKKAKKEKKPKKAKVAEDGDNDETLRVEKETKTETSEFFLKGETSEQQPGQEQVVTSTSSEEIERTDTPTSSTTSKKISIGLPKISLDLGRKKRQVSKDEAPAEVEQVVEETTTTAKPEQGTTTVKVQEEEQPTTGLEQLITPHAEEPQARPPSPGKTKKVIAKPRGFRMNCFRGRRPTSSARGSTEDLTKTRADRQQEQEEIEVTRETTEEQIVAKPEKKEKKGKIKARSKLDKEARKEARERRASETEEEFAERTQRVTKSGGFLSRIFRPRSSSSKKSTSSPSKPSEEEEQVQVIKSTETSHFELAGSSTEQTHPKRSEEREQIVSEMYPSDPDNADGEMILEVNVPEELIREQRQPSIQAQGDDEPRQAGETQIVETVTMTTQFGEHEQRRPESPATPTQPSQLVEVVTSTTPPTFVSEDQEATLVNVSQLDHDEQVEVDEDEATENVVSQTQELPRDREEADKPIVELAPVVSQAPGAPSSIEYEERVEVTREITEQQVEPSESREIISEIVEQVENVPDPKQEKARKELEAKLEKEAKKRAKEDEKLRKRREKEEAKLAALEAKRTAKEEKERVKREAKEAKRLAELAKREAKRTAKTSSKTTAVEPAAPSSTTAAVATSVQNQEEEGEEVEGKPTTITTTTVTTTSTTQGDESALNQQLGQTESGERVLASATTSEVPVNEETEVERTVEEVMGEDGTVTKTTKVVETKYVTMRQEEVRVAERKDIPREEWERIQAEQRPGGQQQVISSSEREIGGQDIVETYRTQRHYIVREPAPYPTPELDEIRATPSYFDPAHVPAEIKPQTSIKKQFAKRVRLNQRIIKRAQKLSRSEAKKAQRDQRRAESEIAVCDCAARQARKELKRAVEEAKRAVKEAEKRHKKMDKIDKEIAKRQKKLEKRQRKIDKKLAKLAKAQAKKQAKLEKRAAKEAKKRSTSSSKSIRLEDIGAPVLRSSSRGSIQQLAAAAGGSQAAIERHLIITEEGTRTHVSRQSSKESQVSTTLTRLPDTIVVTDDVTTPAQETAIRSSSQADTLPAEVPMSLDDATLMHQQEQQQLAHRESISGGQTETTDGATEIVASSDERYKRQAEHAAAMERELGASREEDDEVIDVVGVDEDKPEARGESVVAEMGDESIAQPVVEPTPPAAPIDIHEEEQKPEQQQENEPPVDVEAQPLAADETAQLELVDTQEEQKQDSSNGGTPSKKSKRNKKKKQKSTESAS